MLLLLLVFCAVFLLKYCAVCIDDTAMQIAIATPATTLLLRVGNMMDANKSFVRWLCNPDACKQVGTLLDSTFDARSNNNNSHQATGSASWEGRVKHKQTRFSPSIEWRQTSGPLALSLVEENMTFCRCSAVAYGWCAQAEDIVQRAHYPGHLADKVGGEKRLLAIYFLLVHEIELQRWLNQQKALHNATVLQKNYILRDLADPHTSPYPPEPTPNNRELQQRDCILTNPNVLSKNARDIWSVLHSFDRKSVQHLDWISFFGGSPSRDADFGDFGRWRIRLAFWSAVEQQNSVEHVSLLSEQICSKRNASRPRWAAAMPGSATTTQSRFAEVDRRIRKRHLEMYNVRPVPITGKNHYCEKPHDRIRDQTNHFAGKIGLARVFDGRGVFFSIFRKNERNRRAHQRSRRHRFAQASVASANRSHKRVAASNIHLWRCLPRRGVALSPTLPLQSIAQAIGRTMRDSAKHAPPLLSAIPSRRSSLRRPTGGVDNAANNVRHSVSQRLHFARPRTSQSYYCARLRVPWPSWTVLCSAKLRSS